MKTIKYLMVINIFTILLMACKTEKQNSPDSNAEIGLLQNRYQKLLEYPIDSAGIPRSMSVKTGVINRVRSRDWTSGFYAGNLWQIYQLTGDTRFKERAIIWNAFLEKEKFDGTTHDLGFKVFGSFGKGLEVADNPKYKAIIVKSSETLITRFNEEIGAIRSWDHHKDIWDFPVIIDNMMNLELLFEATKLTGDEKFKNVAIQHANTTLKNHFRNDGSSFHVVDYDTISGNIKSKVTHQGFKNESAWARGQAWGIYGFTMCYRYTKDLAYLKQAEASANFFISHENLPEDGIPYWDFNDTSIPDAPRDASAAAIMASGLIELYKYTNNEAYLNYSDKVVQSLSSDKYLLNDAVNGPFILAHSTGNWPKNDEIDEPIIYADYYFLEAIIRKKAL